MTPSNDEHLENVLNRSHPNMVQRIESLQKANQRMKQTATPVRGSAPLTDHSGPASTGANSTKVSPLKAIERNFLALFKMGRIERIAKDAISRLHVLANQIETLRNESNNHLALVDDKIRKYDAQIERKISESLGEDSDLNMQLRASHAEAAYAFSDLSRRIDLLASKDRTRPENEPGVQTDDLQTQPHSDGFQAFLDFFYHKLENKYRGSRTEIKNRLRVYIPETVAAVRQTNGLKALDLGCGRGEWLELLRDEGLLAEGVDLNALQIEEAVGLGLDVHEGDALQALKRAEDNSVSVITAHHVIEHLPFNQTAWIVREAMRVLAPGGLLILETPNVRNLLVGANTFHDDPTHLKPITDSILKVLYESAGFHPVEARPLHPHSKLAEFLAKDKFDPELAYLLFGAQDIAVLGYKPKEK